MALQILEKNGTFYLDGKINTVTARALIIHFDYMIEKKNNVVINIDNVNEIDRDGVEAIKTLNAMALKNYKMFSVIGNGCEDIYKDFRTSQVA